MTKARIKSAAKRLEDLASKRKQERSATALTTEEREAYEQARRHDLNALEESVVILESAADKARQGRETLAKLMEAADTGSVRAFLQQRIANPVIDSYRRARTLIEDAHRARIIERRKEAIRG